MKFHKKVILHIWNAIDQFLIPLRYVVNCTRFPKKLHLTTEEAEVLLSAIQPDKGQTCLCNNSIEADYDLHIIVPVYNTAPYLKQCLDSIFRQETEFSFFVSITLHFKVSNYFLYKGKLFPLISIIYCLHKPCESWAKLCIRFINRIFCGLLTANYHFYGVKRIHKAFKIRLRLFLREDHYI